MKADDNTMTREERNRLHMERVRAVHRRSAYERVVSRLAYFAQLQAEATVGLRPPLSALQNETIGSLQALRDLLWSEMVNAGQVQ